jgi:hypothetical protein
VAADAGRRRTHPPLIDAREGRRSRHSKPDPTGIEDTYHKYAPDVVDDGQCEEEELQRGTKPASHDGDDANSKGNFRLPRSADGEFPWQTDR